MPVRLVVVLDGDPEQAQALDAALKQGLIKAADDASRKAGVDWREEFGSLEGLVEAMARQSGEDTTSARR